MNTQSRRDWLLETGARCLLPLLTAVVGGCAVRPESVRSAAQARLRAARLQHRAREHLALRWLLVAVQPTNVSVAAQKLRLLVHVHNPDTRAAQLTLVSYALHVAGALVLADRAQGITAVKPEQTVELVLDTMVPLSGLSAVLDARRTGARYRFDGFAVRGDLPGQWPFMDTGAVADLQMAPLRPIRPAL